MKIVKIIAKYDWLILKNDKLLSILGATVLLIGFLATWNGLSRLHERQALTENIIKTDQENIAKNINDLEKINSNGGVFEGNHFRDPRSSATAGNSLAARYAVVPPSPMSVLAVGQSDISPYYYLVSTSKRQGLIHDAEIENAQILFIGSFDWAFILVFLLPLLAIAFTYNIVSAERENGTISLILSEPISFKNIVTYKFLFRYLLLNGLIISLISIVLLLAKAPIFSSEYLLLLLLILGYSAFWFGLSFFVNILWQTSGYNASALVSVWLVLIVFIPSFLNIVVQQLHPMPSRIDLITETRNITDKAREKGNKLLNNYYEDHPELVPKGKEINTNDFGLKSFATMVDIKKALAPTQNKFQEIASKQQALVSNYRFVSPTILMQESLNNLANVGDSQFANFERQVTDYQANLFNYFAPKVFKIEEMTIKDYANVPTFKYLKSKENNWFVGLVVNLLFLLVLGVILVFQGNKRLAKVRL